MLVETSIYTPYLGWSSSLPAHLDTPNTLLILFSDPDLLASDSPCLRDIRITFPQSKLIGCSTATPFVNGQIAQGKAVLSICQFEKSRLKTVMLPIESFAKSREVGKVVAEQLYQPTLRLLYLFADDHILNVNEFMQGVNSIAPMPMLIGGGMAGSPDIITGDRLLVLGNQVQTQAVVAVALYNDDNCLIVEQDGDVGMTSYSPIFEITSAEGRVLHELDGRPALDVYCEFLGELSPYLSDITHSFPAGFFATPDSPLHIVRSVFRVDNDTKSLIFFGDLPPERYIHFMLGFPAGFITSAVRIADKMKRVIQRHGQCPRLLALTISCICRQLALREDVGQEPAAAFAGMPDGTTQLGFYGSGEIAWSGSGYCELHNHTINVTLIGEQ